MEHDEHPLAGREGQQGASQEGEGILGIDVWAVFSAITSTPLSMYHVVGVCVPWFETSLSVLHTGCKDLG